jgi:DNA-binding NtrC family response regulator
VQFRVMLAAIDDGYRDSLAARLQAEGMQVALSDVTATLFWEFRSVRPAVVLLGSSFADERRLPGIAREFRRCDASVGIILLADRGSEALAVAALRAGVDDYFRAPLSLDDLVSSIRRCVPATTTVSKRLPPAVMSHRLVGESAPIRKVRTSLSRVAATDSNVLITGETGTGKELAAEIIHAEGSRRVKRFVSVNCAAIPDTLLESELFGYERGAFTDAAGSRAGLLQQAQGGTVFLDEVGDMSLVAQAKMLRAIESREIMPLGGRTRVSLDVRIIAATNQDLERAVSEGRFRKDLYFRLNVVRIHLPPLRERTADIPSLMTHYVDHFSRRCGRPACAFTDAALASLQRYAWPGNVRELKNLVEAVFAFGLSSRIDVKDLPREFMERLPAATDGADAERERVLAALFEARWNKTRAARQLRCSRMTLYRRMARLQIVRSD